MVTDRPFPEDEELLARYRIVDVDAMERAIDIAVMAPPGPEPGW